MYKLPVRLRVECSKIHNSRTLRSQLKMQKLQHRSVIATLVFTVPIQYVILLYKEYDDFQKLPPFANIYSHQLKTMTAFSDSRSVCRFSFSKYLVHMHKLNLNVLCKSLPNRNGENVVCVNCNAHKSHTNRSKLTLKHWIENWNYHLLINCYWLCIFVIHSQSFTKHHWFFA